MAGSWWGPADASPDAAAPRAEIPAPPTVDGRRSRMPVVVVTGVAVIATIAAAVVAVVVVDHRTSSAAPSYVVQGSATPATIVAPYGVGGDVASTDTPEPTTVAPTTVTPTPGAVPAGYTQVTGPAGVEVDIPAGWPVSSGIMASVDEADDPDDPTTYLRYGGSPSPSMSLLAAIGQLAASDARLGNDYQQLRLDQVTSPTGDETVVWEFLFTKNGVPRHAVDWFWRANGNDYGVYASTSAAHWPDLQPVVQVLEQTAGPV